MRRTSRVWIQWSDTGCVCPVGCSTMGAMVEAKARELKSRLGRGGQGHRWRVSHWLAGRRRNLQALLSVAQIRIASGDTSATTVFRDGNNVDHKLTPPQIVNLFLQSSAYVTEVYAASWALIAFDPIRPIWPRTAIGPANSLIADNSYNQVVREARRGGFFGR